MAPSDFPPTSSKSGDLAGSVVPSIATADAERIVAIRLAGSVEIQRAADCARKWPAATVAQVRAVVPSVVQRVVVRTAWVELPTQ